MEIVCNVVIWHESRIVPIQHRNSMVFLSPLLITCTAQVDLRLTADTDRQTDTHIVALPTRQRYAGDRHARNLYKKLS